MKNKKEILEELKEISPLLADLKKSEVQNFEAPPEGYFNALPDQIFEKINVEKSKETVKQAKPRRSWMDDLIDQLRFLLQPQFAMGFGVALLLFAAVASIIWPKNPEVVVADNKTDIELQESISSDQLYEYVLENIDEFDDELILELASDYPLDFILPDELESEEDLDEIINELLEEVDLSNVNDIL